MEGRHRAASAWLRWCGTLQRENLPLTPPPDDARRSSSRPTPEAARSVVCSSPIHIQKQGPPPSNAPAPAPAPPPRCRAPARAACTVSSPRASPSSPSNAPSGAISTARAAASTSCSTTRSGGRTVWSYSVQAAGADRERRGEVPVRGAVHPVERVRRPHRPGRRRLQQGRRNVAQGASPAAISPTCNTRGSASGRGPGSTTGASTTCVTASPAAGCRSAKACP